MILEVTKVYLYMQMNIIIHSSTANFDYFFPHLPRTATRHRGCQQHIASLARVARPLVNENRSERNVRVYDWTWSEKFTVIE